MDNLARWIRFNIYKFIILFNSETMDNFCSFGRRILFLNRLTEFYWKNLPMQQSFNQYIFNGCCRLQQFQSEYIPKFCISSYTDRLINKHSNCKQLCNFYIFSMLINLLALFFKWNTVLFKYALYIFIINRSLKCLFKLFNQSESICKGN